MNPLKPVSLFFFIFNCSTLLHAQNDTAYFKSYPKLLTTRFYLSQKYTSLNIISSKDNYKLNYLPNTTLNMGVGATYKWFTLNLAYGFPFLNKDDDRGKTKYLDLQFHGYSTKFTLDVLGQFYKGFYLYPKGTASSGSFYQRPDMRVNIVGASFQHVVNNKKFSLRSSVLQNEWQKKSAGSLLVGVEMYGGRIRSDSTLIPAAINEEAADLNETKTTFFEMGPNLGYAYTVVIKQNFFITGSASLGLDFGVSKVTYELGDKSRFGISPNTFLRLSTGYNSADWAASLIYINNGVRLVSPNSTQESTLNTGNLRLNLVYRFHLNAREKKLLEEVFR